MFRYDKSKLGKWIGRGANADIHEYGKQAEGKANYLVKCMPAVNLDKLKQYMEEFALGFNNKHPFILNYKRFDLQEVNQQGTKYMFYIKMKKMKQNLKTLIEGINAMEGEKQRLPLERIIWIFYSLSSALSYLEEKDIVYSNITFESVFIEENDTVKLGVFPFSRYKPWNTWNAPVNKMYQSYLPPERFEKKAPQNTMEKKKELEKKDEKGDDVPADKVADSLFDDDEDEKKEEEKVEKKEKDHEKKGEKDDVPADKVADSLFDDDEEEKTVEKKVEKKEKDPKKKESEKKIAWKSDVWCLGKLIIDICLLRCKISRENSWEVMKNVNKDLREVEKAYPEDPSLRRLMGILQKILVKDSKKRPNFEEICKELESSFPEFKLLEMENLKEKEMKFGEFNGSDIAPEEEKVEDFESSLLSEPVSKRNETLMEKSIEKKISEEHRTIQEDIQVIKENMEMAISNLKKSCRKSLEEITAISTEVSNYKIKHIETSQENIEGFLKKTEKLLETCSESLKMFHYANEEIKFSFAKYISVKNLSSEESSEDISKSIAVPSFNFNPPEYSLNISQESLDVNSKLMKGILK